MSQASNYLENALLDHLIGKATFTPANPFYVALVTSGVTDTDTGSTLTEATYTGYARKSTTPSDWGSASGGSISNTSAITFDACTAGSSTIVGFAIVSANAAGNVYCYGTCSLSVSAGITPQFAVGNLTINLA